ncbi:MAG: chromosome segregation protein SMC [Candidatus Eisenbacteria bacterium]|uniref:Chromosome partition protein Smc n=1 Tax=Eiseniibacteriota bacterium TaxID=2212470 RepID=A0A538SPM5_UNCEI|nr:MAG: chromosome segregation protein SMC [Candidatus Eisenbacteria bacterium]
MFLEKLELQGFKSFVDKTEILFGGGITGVIGPNGCGKTNVSDAIRWVMGEQSARQLRGDSMEDVIFSGSPKRKPLGLAEVHITLRNDRGVLPTEYSEVTISRRVFRSGMSEYFLNKTPCRLKDIRDLFFDTGMGSHAYSVIERQMVDHVLSDNSGHRRFLFEEASGITKYKARKKEALAKLEATEGDLTRLNDIVFEIERELRALARQVAKARRHQRLREEVRDLDLELTAGHVEALRRREIESRDQWQEETVRREGVAAALGALEAGLNDQKLALLELERELTTAQGGLRDREAAAEAAAMRERMQETVGREREAVERRTALAAERDAAQNAAEAAEHDLAAVDAELRGRRDLATERKQLSLDLFSTEGEKRGACERIRERQSSLAERRDAAAARRAELESRVADLGRRLEAGVAGRRDLEVEREEAERTVSEVAASIEALAASVRESAAALAKRREVAAAAESRLKTLLELKREFEGVSEGVKALMGAGRRPAGVLGVVADVLEVPALYLDALEASLGEASAFVLVEDRAALTRALERLRGLDLGRATLVDLASLAPVAPPAIPEGEGVVGRASEVVRCGDRFRPLVERLLGSVVVVLNRETASRLAAGAEGGLRFVSLDGEVWERGRVRAGSAKSLSGLLHREMEIRDLSGQLADETLAIEAQERELLALESGRARLLADRAAAEAEVELRRVALEALVREREAAERESQWAVAESEDRGREVAAVEAELETLARALQQAEEELAAFQRELDQARAQLADLDGAVNALESRRDTGSKRAQEAREKLLALSRDEGEWQAEWARAEQTRRELEAGLSARAAERGASHSQIEEIEAEISGLSAGLTGLLEGESSQRERVVELQKGFAALRTAVQAAEEEARGRRFEHTELAELLHQLELARVQARGELDRTFERLRSEYQMDPESWTPEPPEAGFDDAAVRRQLEEARQKLQTLGAVNLLALEEYTKKKERHSFLVQQRSDLTSARVQLLEAIEKINVTASQLFSETFVKVQEHFRDIFKTLFEGGDAELRMVGEDPLECEIEIAAKPRGKHLQSISLMSGGERALTAIALLFAIYLVKPSPFCLLDEVDAPLDDANVDRFLSMLERFSAKTQFIVITHNKRTMEAAGSLYGVTMEELGVSKLVSVRFESSSNGQGASRELQEVGVG